MVPFSNTGFAVMEGARTLQTELALCTFSPMREREELRSSIVVGLVILISRAAESMTSAGVQLQDNVYTTSKREGVVFSCCIRVDDVRPVEAAGGVFCSRASV